MDKKLNTTYDFKLIDGTTVKLTLSFYALYQLRSKHRSLYERYNKIMANSAKGDYDELDMVSVLYVAYLCANQNVNEPMTEETFFELCGSDRAAVGEAVENLISPKKA